MKYVRTLAVGLLAAAAAIGNADACAQPRPAKGGDSAPEKFRQYRERLLGDYNDYRSRVFDNYDKFLEGVWTELAAFKGEEYNPKPKPKEVPRVPDKKADEPAVTLPKPKKEAEQPDERKEQPAPRRVDDDKPSVPSVAPAELSPFDYYGMEIKLPRMEVQLMNSMRDKNDFARQWRELARSSQADALVAALGKLKKEYKLNDYLTFDMLMKYAAAQYPEVESSSRASLVHFLMNKMGYGVRLGTTDSGVTLLLMPLRQKVFSRSFMEIEGRRYYVFTDDAHTPADVGGFVNTCKLPSGADMGDEIDLRIPDGLNLPYKPHKFDINWGGLNLTGEINANLIPVLYRYPQMPMGDYASSTLMPELRGSLVKQVKEQMKEKGKLEAVNTLLGFIQSGFAYATDEEQHGFEKPYFLEETLYYPKCDCEDRSIMYGYLLSQALGVENHLIFYPGHESVALSIDGELPEPLEGDNYTYQGKRFLISDPTFIGAATGMCMPQYKATTPKIDYVYSIDN